MKVLNLQAEPLADGRIELRWLTPPENFIGVRILRRSSRFPDLDDLGTGAQVYEDNQPEKSVQRSFVDGPLSGETVYYYAVATYDSVNRSYPAFISATTVEPYATGALLYSSLPEIYRLYDRSLPPTPLPVPDEGKGPLLRFVELLSQNFDLLRSRTSAMRTFHDVNRVDGALLPLLAQWIGQQSDSTLDFDRQRNEIRYAPQYHRTAGVAANLRAKLNRLTNWDAKVKEFVHNVFLTTHPEQLTLWETQLQGAVWRRPGNLSLDAAFEGRIATVARTNGPLTLFHHTHKEHPDGPGKSEWHIYARTEGNAEDAASLRLTDGPEIHKHPAAVPRADGSMWLFYATHRMTAGRLTPTLDLQTLAQGRAAGPARILGTAAAPFNLADGDVLDITIGTGPTSVRRIVTLRTERLRGNLAAVAAGAMAQFLDRELPGVTVTAEEGRILLATLDKGAPAALKVTASTLATKLGLSTVLAQGTAAAAAQLEGLQNAPFALADKDSLILKVDGGRQRTIVFPANRFVNIAAATAAEVTAAINAEVPGLARVNGAAVRLVSPSGGPDSLVSVLTSESTAASKLGFGTLLPAAPAGKDEDEPSACVATGGTIWLFWASRRDDTWKIWYSALSGGAWGIPKTLTTGDGGDREPFVLFDPAGTGRLWVFWSRKKANGLWNVFSRTTTNLNFATITNADWTEVENAPVPLAPPFDNREPAATISSTGQVELFFASNRADGWNLWTRQVTTAAQGAESAVTTGQATRRAPTPVRVSPTLLRLFHRSNESMTYVSDLYPSAETRDSRYSGSSTADFRNPARLSLRGQLLDMMRYTSDVRRQDTTNSSGADKQVGLFARECVGVYLTPDTTDQALILRQRQFFVNALRRVIPIQVRLAFLIDRVDLERVYTYEAPEILPPITIGETMIDTIIPEVLVGVADEFADFAPGMRFLRMWAPGETSVLPDLSVAPPNLRNRLFTATLKEK